MLQTRSKTIETAAYDGAGTVEQDDKPSGIRIANFSLLRFLP